MRILHIVRIIFMVCSNVLIINTPALAESDVDGIYVNGVELSFGQTLAIRMAYDIPDGRYWYDSISGLWGLEGNAPKGLLIPGIEVGGPLEAKVSYGNTGVLLNGRELPRKELISLERSLGKPITPARYWMDEKGNIGYEGESAVVCLKITEQYKKYN